MTRSSEHRWFGLLFISIAVSLIIVDSTIVNVTIPAIVTDLGITSTQVQWVQESYTVVFASLLLLFGSVADRFGRRRMLIIGTVIFAASSVAAALSTTGGPLIAARFVQGIGGAMILPTTLSLINATFRGRERGIAFAVWGSTIGGMAALGPLLGGWLTTDLSWRWAFGINIPLGAMVIAGVVWAITESRVPARPSFDMVGALLSVVLFGSLVLGLIQGRTYGWWKLEEPLSFAGIDWPLAISPIPFFFALALVALIGFFTWEKHQGIRGKPALLDLSLFNIRSFRTGNVAALVVALGEFGIILSLPLWLQFVLGFSALQTGLVLLALAGGSFMASGLAGASSGKVSPALIVRTGLILEIIGVTAIGSIVLTGIGWGWLLPALAIYGIGVGLATAQLSGVILVDVPVEKSGQASGTQSTARQVGSALGIAILGTVLYSSTGSVLASKLDAMGVASAQSDEVVSAVVDSAGGAIASLEAQESTHAIGEAAGAALSQGTAYAAFTAAGFLVIGFLATLRLGRGNGSSVSESQQPDSA